MSDPWSDALQEAYAYASGSEDIILSTIELMHPTFVDPEDTPVPIRMVNQEGDLLIEGDEEDPESFDVYGFNMGIEEGATYNAGETVTFVSVGFELGHPAQEEGKLGSFTISFDNITKKISKQLDNALTVRAPITMIYREYLHSDLTTPQLVVALLNIRSVSSTVFRVEAVASFTDLVNKRVPNIVYRPKDFPGLVT